MFRQLRLFKFSQQWRFIKDKTPTIGISTLTQGPTLLSEQSSFPAYSDIGICFRAGHRDERPNERGSLFNVKQYLYSTPGHDILENFESVLRSGCMLDLIQDQELTYFKCSFLQDDLEYILDTLFKLALNEKQISETHRQNFSQQEENPAPFDELIIHSAFNGQLMGNMSFDGQNSLPSQQTFLQFQREKFTPQNMIIGYAGVSNHQEIEKLIKQNLSMYPQFLKRQNRPSDKAQFKPGTFYFENRDSEELNFAIVYEGYSWRHPDMAIFQIMNSILGNSASWSTGGPGKGMRARATINMMNCIASIESASAVINHFTDSGLFGMKVGGWRGGADELINSIIQELRKTIEYMSDEEFQRGQNILNSQIQLNLERQADRLEEQVKNLFTFGQLIVPQYMDRINKVTKKQLQDKMTELINEKLPVVVYQGSNLEKLPKMEEIVKLIRK